MVKKRYSPLVIGHAASRADKVRIQRRVVLIHRMAIATGGIGLPDFDQRIRTPAARLRRSPRPTTMMRSPSASLPAPRVACEIILTALEFDVAKQRPGNLRQSLVDRHELLQRPAFDRRAVRLERCKADGISSHAVCRVGFSFSPVSNHRHRE